MKQAQFQATKIARKDRKVAIATRAERVRTVKRIVGDIERQFPGIKLDNLTERHVMWWVRAMRAGKLSRTRKPPSVGTQKNDLVAMRFLLGRIGKSNLLPRSNSDLGIEKRNYVATLSVAIDVTPEQLELIQAHSPRYALSVQLMRAFGLRCEESLKIVPSVADRGFELHLEGAWCKNGRPRCVPIHDGLQRAVLEKAQAIAGYGSMVPPGLTYVEARSELRKLTAAMGLSHRHGLRHGYVGERYFALTGALPPVVTGLTREDVSEEEVVRDRAARSTIALELGHARRSVLGAYLGSLFRSRREP